MSIKMPLSPPPLSDLLREMDGLKMVRALSRAEPVYSDKKYRHWNDLIHLDPPDDLTHEEWWFGIKMKRAASYQSVPLHDTFGLQSQFLLTEIITEQLHHIDLGAGGRIGVPDLITNPDTRDQYYISSLMEEAITSSQLEGATTTREVAKDMIRAARPPQDRNERMILNNYHTMQRIGTLKGQPLTKEIIFELHRIVTEGTLENPSATGRFRKADEEIVVQDIEGRVYHTPPSASELDDRMAAMCAFANAETPEGFVHPVLRSIILHFWLAYDHPFVDGNGRTARALFYWSMLHYGYWLCEFISISRVILQARVKYTRAFLYTETDGNDLTYFLLYHIEVLRRSLQELHDHIARRTAQLKAMEQKLQGMAILNHRQRALLNHSMRHPHYKYTIEAHRRSHNVAYQTARTDLMNLQDRGLMKAAKVGQTWYFTPQPDLEARLARPT